MTNRISPHTVVRFLPVTATSLNSHYTKAPFIFQPDTNTREAYVDLAMATGGASWALRILRNSSLESNQDIQDSFTSALAEVKLNEIRASVQSCRRYARAIKL